MTKRNYSNVAPPLPLGAAVNSSATTLQVTSTTGYPAVPFILALERGTASEEVVLCTAKTSTTFTVTRGYDGTTAAAHGLGAMVEHTVAAIDYREASGTPMTTSERDALSGADRWDGMFITNTTTDTIERWDGSSWVAMARMGDVTTAVANSAATKADKTITISPGSGLTGGGDLSTNRTLTVNFHSSGVATTVPRSDDARFSDARTPLAHSHAQSDITGLTSALGNKSDVGHTHTPSAIVFSGGGKKFWADDGSFKSVIESVGAAWKGAYSALTSYAAGDLVELDGRVVRAKQAISPGAGVSSLGMQYLGTWRTQQYGGTTSNFTVTIPAGTVKKGDLLLAGSDQSAGFITDGTVWTQVPGSPNSNSVYFRYATAADEANGAGVTVMSQANVAYYSMWVRAYRRAMVDVAGWTNSNLGSSATSSALALNIGAAPNKNANMSQYPTLAPSLSHTELWVGQHQNTTSSTVGLDATTTAAAQNLYTPPASQGTKHILWDRAVSAGTSWVSGQQMTSTLGSGNSYTPTAVVIIPATQTVVDPAYWEVDTSLHDAAGVKATRVSLFDSSGVWSKPAGATRHRVIVAGAGGGGYNTYGGGGGGFIAVDIEDEDLPGAVGCIVGAGGTGSSSAPTSGGRSMFNTGGPTAPFSIAADGGIGTSSGQVSAQGGATYLHGNTVTSSWNNSSSWGTSILWVSAGPLVHAGSGSYSGSGIPAGGGGRGGGQAGAAPATLFGYQPPNTDGDLTRMVPGSGGHGGGYSGGPSTGRPGGKYGGGGGAGNGSTAGGNGGQGGICVISYFD